MQHIQAKQALLPDGWKTDIQITISPDGLIDYVGPNISPAGQQVDLLLPAPVNLHSHTFQRAMAGLTETKGPASDDNFWTWRTLMYRFLDQLKPDQIEKIAALAFMEMLEAGFAGVVEFHYLHHGQNGNPYSNLSELSNRIIAAAETSGIGLTLLPVLYQYGGCDKRPLVGGQQRFENNPDQFAKLFETASAAISHSHRDYHIGVAPHSLRAVDLEGLTCAVELCRDGPIHMHLAEQLAEVTEFEEHFAARPAEWLFDNFDIDNKWTLIHCTQMNSTEITRLANSGAVAGLCPLTEANLGDGIFNATQYLDAGGAFGVGSDSNIQISLFEELKSLEYSQRLRDHSRSALATREFSTGRILYEKSVTGGAQAASRNCGAIAVGMCADMIGIETDNQWLHNRRGDNNLDSLIFSGGGSRCIKDVWSAGRHTVKEGRHVNRDKIIHDYKKTISQLEHDI